jgi:aminocarboxymuconate-semialdehyde decarboxylase
MIVSNINGVSVAAPEFQPIFEAAERLRAPLLLHPILPVAADRFGRYELTVALGFLFDTTLAATQLVLGGLYEQYPRLTLVLGHAGSLLPQLAGRIDLEAKRNPMVRGRLSVLPSEHLRFIYTDTVCGWPAALRSALTLFGSKRVMFGSDFPFWDHGPSVETLSELARTDQLPAGVKADNATRIFRLDSVHVTSDEAAEHVS